MTTTPAIPAAHTAFEIHRAEAARRRSTRTKYAVETLGTLFLVLTIGTALHSGSPLAPLAIGAMLTAMIYAGGHLSGAHYNPAVTIAALVRGRLGAREAVGYWIAQCIGGLLGAAVVDWVLPHAAARPVPVSAPAVIAELLFSFALCYVVLNVATSKDHPDNQFYGLAIGFTVLAGAVAVGGISGAAFNPAVVLGGTAMGLFSSAALWAYLPVQIIAGAAAGAMFAILNPTDK